jgi:hypothetical protein
MPLMGFEAMIPVFKQAKTFHALDRAATVTGTGVSCFTATSDLLLNSQTHILYSPISLTTERGNVG